MTVDNLLTGRSRPLTHKEFVGWLAYTRRKTALEKQARNKV